jgi:hypothetical protein
MSETSYNCNNGKTIEFNPESNWCCLCTFPHNDEVMGKKLTKGTVASLALLGAGIAIVANKPESINHKAFSCDGNYYMPDCIPQWIQDEILRILELKDE